MKRVEHHSEEITGGLHFGRQFGGKGAEILAESQLLYIVPQPEEHFFCVCVVYYVAVPARVDGELGIAQGLSRAHEFAVDFFGSVGKGSEHPVFRGQQGQQAVTFPRVRYP